MNKNKFSTKYLVEMALLVAIILLMAFTPIGYIKTAGLEITLIVVPVAVGAVTLGPTAGAILGGVFGITSFIQCFGMSQFGALLLGINPFLTFRTYLSWITKNKDSVSSIRYDRQPLLPIIEYNILYGNACDIICIHHA